MVGLTPALEIEFKAPRMEDLECFHEVFSDRITNHYIIDEGILDLEQSRVKLQRLIEFNPAAKQIFTVHHLDQAVGFVVVHIDNSDHPFISYAIRRKFWRRGFARQALQRLLEIGKKDFSGFRAATHLDNVASQSLLLRCGFSKVGTKQLDMGERVLFEYQYAAK
jgi:RimJ/RimL family protein N-acetyltransferase